MIYSVWNQPSREYDYYETTQAQLGANTPAPKHIGVSDRGLAIDNAGWPLPASSVKTGSGPTAKGRIASSRASNALGAINVDVNTIGFLGFGLAAYLLWKSGFLKA